jgi:transketolase
VAPTVAENPEVRERSSSLAALETAVRGAPFAPTPDADSISALPEIGVRAKLRLLRMHYESKVGHVGGNLSSLDILLSLYGSVLTKDDVFVLSKGHSAGALYIALWTVGLLKEEDLLTFHKDNTRLSGHPPAQGMPEIMFATGSLGHGLSLAAGVALGKRLKGENGRLFCLMSDGEWNEGSCWEALIFLIHQNLGNLTFIVDLNGLQGFGTTREVANLDSLVDTFRAFNIRTIEVDGHDYRELTYALSENIGPIAIIAKTRKGCGVSFMENEMAWHYLPMNKGQYEQAVEEVVACAKLSAIHL